MAAKKVSRETVVWTPDRGQALRDLRHDRMYSQKRLASECEVSIGRVCAVEIAAQAPSMKLLRKIDNVLGTGFANQFEDKTTFRVNGVRTKRVAREITPSDQWRAEHAIALHDARVSQGVRQTELAQQVGCANSKLSNVERCLEAPSYDLLSKLDTVLGTSLHQQFNPLVRIATTQEQYGRIVTARLVERVARKSNRGTAGSSKTHPS